MKWLYTLLLVGCMSPVMTFGGGKSAEQAQHDYLTDLLPAQLAIDGTWKGPVKDAKVRVYADDAYRAQNRDWRRTFGESLDYVNAVLGSNFGVRLVADYREWSHHDPASTLHDHLDELRRHDAGDGVMCVIGLTSSLSLVTATFEQLGYASVPGRHMMLRGYADLEERRAFEDAFPKLSADERENALEARRRHKAAAILLHELAHNLGADHERAEQTLMNASYSEKAAAFSPGTHAALQRAIDQRLGRAPGAGGETAQTAARGPIVHIRIKMDTVVIDGIDRDDDELNIWLGMTAGLADGTQVMFEYDRSVTADRVRDVFERAKRAGFSPAMR